LRSHPLHNLGLAGGSRDVTASQRMRLWHERRVVIAATL